MTRRRFTRIPWDRVWGTALYLLLSGVFVAYSVLSVWRGSLTFSVGAKLGGGSTSRTPTGQGHTFTPESNPLVFWGVVVLWLAVGIGVLTFGLRSLARHYRKRRRRTGQRRHRRR